MEESVIRLPIRIRPFIRTMWYFWAAVLLGIIILNVPSQLNVIAETTQGELPAAAPLWLVSVANITTIFAQSAVSLISLALAAVLILKRPGEGMALLVSYFLLVNGVVAAPSLYLESVWPEAHGFTYSVIQPLFFIPLLIAFLSTFPNGRPVPSWTRWLIFLGILSALIGPIIITDRANPTPIYIAHITISFALIFTGFYAQIYRYHHVSNLIERQQAKWVIYGFTLTVLFVAPTTIWTIIHNSQAQPVALSWWAPLLNLGWYLAYATLPIALTLAVMRYRLFDIDLIINRTLVYGALTAGVGGLYALVVGGLGVLFQSSGNLIVALVATGLIAVLFQPLRERLQRAVNQLMYGARDDPFEALAQLGKRLETAVPSEDILPMLVETIAQTLKLPYVGIRLKDEPVETTAVEYGTLSQEPVDFPLTYQGENVGRLVVAPRSPGNSFISSEMRLLRNIARQAGAAVQAAQLTADLQRSLQRLVTTREEERRRLRRDLHDGLGPALASIVWQADSARDLVNTDPSEAVHLLESSIEQAQAALADIRRLVYGLRPPALDELGLVGALEQATRQHQQTAVTIKASPSLPTLPAAVEVAAYRIVQEALKNAVEHGRADSCLVGLAFDGNLCLTIGDDGLGLPEMVTPGIGLVSMRERAEELGGTFKIRPRLGGGTNVEVSLPLELGR